MSLPKPGDGATIRIGSDRYAATVVEVKPFKTGPRTGQVRAVVVRYDAATMVGEGYDAQSYAYAPDPHGRLQTFFADAGGNLQNDGYRLRVGERSAYRDPHF